MAKVKFGVRPQKKVKSPTGQPSKKSAGMKKFLKGDYSGGPPVKKKAAKKNAKKKGFQKGTIPRVEEVLKRSGA
jgi:hypothetical protein